MYRIRVRITGILLLILAVFHINDAIRTYLRAPETSLWEGLLIALPVSVAINLLFPLHGGRR